MESKNMCAQILCELLSGTNLISFCTTDFSPSELLLKKAIALLQAMEPMLVQEAKEGEQVQQNLTGGRRVEPFYKIQGFIVIHSKKTLSQLCNEILPLLSTECQQCNKEIYTAEK